MCLLHVASSEGPAQCPPSRGQTVNIYSVRCCDGADFRLKPWLREKTTVPPKLRRGHSPLLEGGNVYVSDPISKLEPQPTLCPRGPEAERRPQCRHPALAAASPCRNSGLEVQTLGHWDWPPKGSVQVMNDDTLPLLQTQAIFLFHRQPSFRFRNS